MAAIRRLMSVVAIQSMKFPAHIPAAEVEVMMTESEAGVEECL